MAAWLLGVTRILYWVAVVVAEMLVVSVMAGVSEAGLLTEPWTTVPASLVISTRLRPAEVPAASVTVTAVMASVPLLVWTVNASAMVAAPPGARLTLPGSVPVASVVVGAAGVAGDPVGTTPPETKLPLVSRVR